MDPQSLEPIATGQAKLISGKRLTKNSGNNFNERWPSVAGSEDDKKHFDGRQKS